MRRGWGEWWERDGALGYTSDGNDRASCIIHAREEKNV